ncbi:MAG: zinc-ribbon domain-containing protein, partial [Thermoplasmata archaeon]
MKFCPYCGTKNQDKYNFCIKCHEPLPSADGTKDVLEDIVKRDKIKGLDISTSEFFNKKVETNKVETAKS